MRCGPKGQRKMLAQRKGHPAPQEHEEGRDDQPTHEVEVIGMQEDTPEEKRTMEMTALVERDTSFENENRELKKVIDETATKIGLQDAITREIAKRQATVETVIVKIAEHVQGQATFTETEKDPSTAWRTKWRLAKATSRNR